MLDLHQMVEQSQIIAIVTAFWTRVFVFPIAIFFRYYYFFCVKKNEDKIQMKCKYHTFYVLGKFISSHVAEAKNLCYFRHFLQPPVFPLSIVKLAKKIQFMLKLNKSKKKNQNFRLCETIIFFSQPNTISITK